jgi:hypothetical protein
MPEQMSVWRPLGELLEEHAEEEYVGEGEAHTPCRELVLRLPPGIARVPVSLTDGGLLVTSDEVGRPRRMLGRIVPKAGARRQAPDASGDESLLASGAWRLAPGAKRP